MRVQWVDATLACIDLLNSHDLEDMWIIGSEVAHQVSLMLATVRRSNRAYGFPVHGFHRDSIFWNTSAASEMNLACTRWIDPVGWYPRMKMYGYFR